MAPSVDLYAADAAAAETVAATGALVLRDNDKDGSAWLRLAVGESILFDLDADGVVCQNSDKANTL